MKVERISDKQVKFIITNDDLRGRNIMLAELVSGSESIHELLHDMMRCAQEECDFQAENVPLMIEVGRADRNSIMVIITKMDGFDELDNKIGRSPRFQQLMSGIAAETRSRAEKAEAAKSETSVFVYSFENLDHVFELAARIYGKYAGASSLYKFENRLYLVAQNAGLMTGGGETIELLLSEYGTKHSSSGLYKQFLAEHGEIIIKNAAVDKLAMYQ